MSRDILVGRALLHKETQRQGRIFPRLGWEKAFSGEANKLELGSKSRKEGKRKKNMNTGQNKASLMRFKGTRWVYG